MRCIIDGASFVLQDVAHARVINSNFNADICRERSITLCYDYYSFTFLLQSFVFNKHKYINLDNFYLVNYYKT